jgi:chromate transporter
MAEPSHGVSLGEAFRVWLRVAALSFGGPAGQIAVMHRILVEEKRWISENRFLHALNYCMLLPGPEAQQLATYVGWLMHRTLGGIMAGGLFILPGVVAIMALSWIYALYGKVGFVSALFFGLKAAVLAVVLEAVVRIGKKSLKNNVMVGLAAAAFVAIYFCNIPFPIIISRRHRLLGAWPAPGSQPRGLAERAPVVDACSATSCPTRAADVALLRVGIWLALWLDPLSARHPWRGCFSRSPSSSPRWPW